MNELIALLSTQSLLAKLSTEVDLMIHEKTPSFIPGQRCPENLEISIITDVHFSNFDYSEVAEDNNELLSYSEKLVF